MDRRFFGEEKGQGDLGQSPYTLVGGCLMIPLDAILTAGIKQHLCTHHISLQENRRILNRAIYVALCCKVYDNVRLFLLEDAINRLAIRNVCLDELKMRVCPITGAKCFHIARIGQRLHAK